MIVLVVCSPDKITVERIAKLLVEEHLAIDINIELVERVRLKGDDLVASDMFRLMGKTKALLFPTIDKKLHEMLDGVLPEIYSIPIVHMDWEQTLKLRQDVQGV